MVNLHIGFDDTDSPNGGCTTYIAALLVEKFSKMHFTLTDYPGLIRLNPNVPYKTRGNGAVAIRLSGLPDMLSDFKKHVKRRLNQWLDPNIHAQPGVAFIEGHIPNELGTGS